jgi:WD40 repeat protein
MSTRVRCPRPTCGQALVLPAAAPAGRLRCPKCGQVFALPAAAPPAGAPTLTTPPAAPAPTLDLPVGQPPAGITPAPQPAAALPACVGRFQVRDFLGEGAFGRVYKAHDPQLDRLVALKVAKPELSHSEQRVKRFLGEARAAANLRHPHIVPVFDSGQDGPHLYIASAFIAGRSLDRALAERPPRPREAAEVVRKLADALAYAHGRGVIHRDVKPANVLLDEQGEPLLADFGLAVRAAGEERLTQEGAGGPGTPAYMAPEHGRGQAVAASDQYSLGCTLFELLTGQTPFAGPSELQLFLHASQQPPSLRQLNRAVPRDLETITLKCLEKEPAKRYTSCQELSDDLRRWLDGLPIRARRLRLPVRVWRWAKRKPALTASLAALALLVAVGVPVTLKLVGRAEKSEQQLGEKETEVQALGQKVESKTEEAKAADVKKRAADLLKYRREYLTDMGEAQLAWQGGQPERVRDLLERHRTPPKDMPDLRAFEWYYWQHLLTGSGRVFRGGGHEAAFSPDGKSLVVAYGPEVVLWDLASGKEARNLGRLPRPPERLLFSPDGKYLAAARTSVRGERIPDNELSGFALSPRAPNPYTNWPKAVPGLVRVWEAESGREAASFTTAPGWWLRGLAFSPDGRLLAAGWEDPLPGQLVGRGALLSYGRLSPNDYQMRLKVWDVADGKERCEIGPIHLPNWPRPATLQRSALSFSPDGSRLALQGVISGGRQGTPWEMQWDTATGQRTQFTPSFQVAFSPRMTRPDLTPGNMNQFRMDVAPDRKAFTLTPLPGGRNAPVLLVHRVNTQDLVNDEGKWVRCVAFSPDSRQVATGAGNVVRVWSAVDGAPPGGRPPTYTLRGHAGDVLALTFSSDGTRLASLGKGSTRVWPLDEDQGYRTLGPQGGMKAGIAPGTALFAADGRRMASVSFRDSELVVVDLPFYRVVFRQRLPKGAGNHATLSPDGRRLACSVGGALKAWELAEGRLLFERASEPLDGLTFSPDGALLAGIRPDGVVVTVQAADGAELATFGTPSQEAKGRKELAFQWGFVFWKGVAFSQDGKHLYGVQVSRRTVQRLVVWGARTGQELHAVDIGIATVHAAAVSPDGRLAAVSGQGANRAPITRLLELPGGAEAGKLDGAEAVLMESLCFSPDGGRLATLGESGLRLWDTATGAEVWKMTRVNSRYGKLHFSPDGTTLLLDGLSGRAWDAPR